MHRAMIAKDWYAYFRVRRLDVNKWFEFLSNPRVGDADRHYLASCLHRKTRRPQSLRRKQRSLRKRRGRRSQRLRRDVLERVYNKMGKSTSTTRSFNNYIYIWLSLIFPYILILM